MSVNAVNNKLLNVSDEANNNGQSKTNNDNNSNELSKTLKGTSDNSSKGLNIEYQYTKEEAYAAADKVLQENALEIPKKYQKYEHYSTSQLKKILEKTKNEEERTAITAIISSRPKKEVRIYTYDENHDADQQLFKQGYKDRIYGENASERTKEFVNKAIKAFMEAEVSDDATKQEKQLFKRKDKFTARENIYTSRKEYRAAKREAKENGMSLAEFKEQNARITDKHVKAFLQANGMMTEKGEVDVQKLQNFVLQYTGLDLQLNYGIHAKDKGGAGQDEIAQFMAATGLSKSDCRKLIKAAGASMEKSDKAAKVFLAGLGAGSVGAIAGTGVTHVALPDFVVEAIATSSISLNGQPVGSAMAQAAATISAGATVIGFGAALAAAVAMINTALTYNYDGKKDVMNGEKLENVIACPQDLLEFQKNVPAKDKKEVALACEIIQGLKEAGIPNEAIYEAIDFAKGNTSGNGVNLTELMAACMALKGMKKEDFLQHQEKKCPEAKPAETKTEEKKEAKTEAKPEQNPTSKDGGKVTVMNGESFARIAKKYGVDVDKLKEMNKDKIHHYTDCNDKKHYFFRVGEEITLPQGANQEAVKDNQDNVKKVTEIKKYDKAVLSNENINKRIKDNCPPTTSAQGDQVAKKVDEEIKRRGKGNLIVNEAIVTNLVKKKGFVDLIIAGEPIKFTSKSKNPDNVKNLIKEKAKELGYKGVTWA